ncbi:MAG: alpha/beta fold hydrolase, partial [Desulfotomaculales bacterium]
MENFKVKANGIEFHVVDFGGKGETIFCVHGLMANCLCWEAAASALTGEYRVIAYDLRGRGDSQKPPSGYGLWQHVEDVKSLVLSLGLGKIIYMGHSLGAHIGVCFAARYPDLLSHLVLVDGGADLDPRTGSLLTPLIEILDRIYPDYGTYLEQYKNSPLFPEWNSCLANYLYFNVHHNPDGSVQTKCSKKTVAEEIRNNSAVSLNELHREIRVPTLILQAPLGFGNPELPVVTRAKGEEMASLIPGGRFVSLEGTNHFTIIFNASERLAAEVKNFLRRR